MKEQCLAWLRETDTKLHAVDLKPTLDEKKQQLEILKVRFLSIILFLLFFVTIILIFGFVFYLII